MKKDISKAVIGDTIYTYDVLGNPYSFVIDRIEDQTEGGSTKWGRVFYDNGSNFMTEYAIAKVNGIFADSEPVKREGYAI